MEVRGIKQNHRDKIGESAPRALSSSPRRSLGQAYFNRVTSFLRVLPCQSRSSVFQRFVFVERRTGWLERRKRATPTRDSRICGFASPVTPSICDWLAP
eukprot:2575664-Pyramimonas_sp.AAC.1